MTDMSSFAYKHTQSNMALDSATDTSVRSCAMTSPILSYQIPWWRVMLNKPAIITATQVLTPSGTDLKGHRYSAGI